MEITAGGPTMRRSWFGRAVARRFRPSSRISHRLLSLALKSEGGEMLSLSLRDVLRDHYGVDAGEFAYGSLLQPGFADKQTVIGRYVSCGPNVRRFGAAHPMEHTTLHPFAYSESYRELNSTTPIARSPIHIGDDSWIGANVVILPGVKRIGVCAVIGAGAVVTRDVADFAVVVGNPARQIHLRLTPELRDRLLSDQPWDLAPAEAMRYHRELVER